MPDTPVYTLKVRDNHYPDILKDGELDFTVTSPEGKRLFYALLSGGTEITPEFREQLADHEDDHNEAIGAAYEAELALEDDDWGW